MCDTPTDVAVRIQSDYDDLVEFARALASKTTYEECGRALSRRHGWRQHLIRSAAIVARRAD